MYSPNRRAFSVLAAAAIAACNEAPPSPEQRLPSVMMPTDNGPKPCATAACTPLPPIEPYSGTHVLDAAVHESFVRAGVTFEPASNSELCRRLMGDLLGRLPTEGEIATECTGRTAEAIVSDFQTRDRYFLVAERWWRDRLNTNDVLVDWRYLQELYDLVDELHRGTLSYGEFATQALAHPGLVMQQFLPEDMARHVFPAFLGREASDAEASDLAALYRPWIPSQELDPDFPYIYTFTTYIAPQFCEPISACTSSLFGGATLDIPSSPFITYIPYGNLSPIQKDALRVVGDLFVRQPFFWEAAADAMLSRYLGWSDGGRFPREPGVVLPELRQALAQHLKETGDYPAAERLLLTSWVYLQNTHVAPDGHGDDPAAPQRPIFAYGPVKAAQAEVWMDSIAPATYVDIGTCDPRYPDFYGYLLLYDAYDVGLIETVEQLAADLARLYEMQQPRFYLADVGNGFGEPSFLYTYYARQLGGCPGFGTPRGEPAGLAFGFAQETFAELACEAALNTWPAKRDPSLEDVVDHQMRLFYGRAAEVIDMQFFLDAYGRCAGDDCAEEERARSVCTALAGSSEVLFY